jgi:hypothetical protein
LGDETYIRDFRTFPALANGVLVVPTYWGPIYAFASGTTNEPGVKSPPSETEPPVQTQSPAPSETAPPKSTPPDTSPPRTEPSQSPPPGPEPLHIPEYLIVVAGIIGGILLLMLYMWQNKCMILKIGIDERDLIITEEGNILLGNTNIIREKEQNTTKES